MDVVTLGAALNGAKAQTESYVENHFTAGANITITDNADGTQTIAASGEVSSEDTVARAAIDAIKDGTTIDSFGDVETALADKVDVVSGKGLSANDFTDTLKSKLDNIASGAEVNVQSDWNQTTDTADDFIKNKPTLGTAAAAATTDFATAAQGTKADSAIQGVKVNSTTVSPDSNKIVNITVPTSAADVSAIPTSAKGAASGVAELDSNGKVPSSQLPSYVDDVIEGYYYNSKFYVEATHTTEITGETGKIYIDLSGTNKTYRWSGSGYTEISESLALGETSSTAYRGDRGKTAYDHATETRLTTATASGLYKVASTAEGHIASLSSVQKSDITDLGIPAQDTTYVFEGTYNATTNKAATMADIKDGKLTGYAQASGDVAATDKIIEAIGKVEKKADDNKNNILSKCVVCTCSTAAATSAKVVDAPSGFVLQTGCIIGVKFTYSNSVDNVTLNVGGTGAKPIGHSSNYPYTGHTAKITGTANNYTYYMYDGTYWVYIAFSQITSAMGQAEASAGTSNTERLMTAKVLSDTIDEKLVPVENNILLKADKISFGFSGNPNPAVYEKDWDFVPDGIYLLAYICSQDASTRRGVSVYMFTKYTTNHIVLFTPVAEASGAIITSCVASGSAGAETITFTLAQRGYHTATAIQMVAF